MSCTVDIRGDGLGALVSEPHLTILTTVEQIFDYDNSICMQYTNNRMEIVFNLAIISNEISRVSRSLAYAVRVEGELNGMIWGVHAQIITDTARPLGGPASIQRAGHTSAQP